MPGGIDLTSEASSVSAVTKEKLIADFTVLLCDLSEVWSEKTQILDNSAEMISLFLLLLNYPMRKAFEVDPHQASLYRSEQRLIIAKRNE